VLELETRAQVRATLARGGSIPRRRRREAPVVARAVFRAGLACLALVCGSVSARAQDPVVSVPFEYTSGFVAGHAAPTPFAASVHTGLLGRLDDGQVLIGAAGALLYSGKSWHGAAGARLAWRVPPLGVRDAGVFLVGEALKGHARTPLSVGAVAEIPISAAGFVRFGAWVTRDTEQKTTTISLLVGTDVARWVAHFASSGGPHRVDTQP
jgi:hypothetical protein